MVDLTARLSLHKPATAAELMGTLFPTNFANDLQKIDDEVQIKNLAGAGYIPYYDENGLLIPSEIMPEDLEGGLESLLTDQGMILIRNATTLAALSPSTSGKSLLTYGAGADPAWGYPSHNTLLNLTVGNPHTQYALLSLLTTRGSIIYRGVTAWTELLKGATPAGYMLMMGADDPYWGLPKLDDFSAPDDNTDLNVSTSKHGLCPKAPNDILKVLLGDASWGTPKLDNMAEPDDNTDLDASTTRHGLMKKYVSGSKKILLEDGSAADNFAIAMFPFGDGSSVVTAGNRFVSVPKACKIIAAEVRSVDANGDLKTGSITFSVRIHDYNADADSVTESDSFALSNSSSLQETGLSISVADGKYITAIASGIATVTDVVLTLKLEAT